MNVCRPAFTMIELIFVIVILGILAAIAIPKLAAVRMDAEVSRKARSIMLAVSDVTSFAISRGGPSLNLYEMSGAIESLVLSGDATIDHPNNPSKKIFISTDAINQCITIQINNDKLDMTFGDPQSDVECNALQSLISVDSFPVFFGGSRVVY